MAPYHPQSINNAPFNSLQHLGFQRFMPHPQLRPWVQCYWIARRDQLPNHSMSETVYPDAGSSLGLDFAGGELPVASFNATRTSGKMVFTGSIHRIGIRFHPGGAFQLLGVEMSALTQDEFSADALALPDIEQLQYQLLDASEISQRLTLIDAWLLKRANITQAANGLVQQLLPRLMLAQEPIADLSSHLPISLRQLERRFQVEVGFSPAQVKQLHRIKLARALISQRPDQPLVQIAMDTGFYDQAHFIRQFQKITGLTPNQYRLKKMSQKYNPSPT